MSRGVVTRVPGDSSTAPFGRHCRLLDSRGRKRPCPSGPQLSSPLRNLSHPKFLRWFIHRHLIAHQAFLNYMQLLHRFSPIVKFLRAQVSSSLLLSEQTFMVRVRLALLSPCSKWPQYARWSIASLGDLRLTTYPFRLRSLQARDPPWAPMS
jgi:hypothetical protein